MIRRAAALLAACSMATACTSGGDAVPSPSVGEECRSGFQTPPGFSSLETLRQEYGDHVGVRIGFVDDRGRELHVFAGIPGEFGEGLPAAGRVSLPSGRMGLVSGEDRIWVVQWMDGGPCDPRAVLGNGLTRRRFLSVVAEGMDAGG